MAKIIGNTTATPNPRPDWNQTDSTKADYIKNKPVVLTEEQVKGLIDEFGGDTQVQADFNQTDETKSDYIKNKPDIPTKTSDLTNDAGYLTSYTETDPTVPSWAKASTKPTYTKSEVGLGNVDNVKQYSASNPPPYPVTKVNNKTGDVTLTASDVGADASGTANSAVSEHNANTSAHADIREQISQLSSEKVVLYSTQTLTAAEKIQARANIGAASADGEVLYTNLADPSSADWKDGYRIGSSALSAQTGKTTTNLIEWAVGDVIRVKGITGFEANVDRVCDTADDVTNSTYTYTYMYVSNLPNDYFGYEVVDGVHTFTLLKRNTSIHKYFRCCFNTPTDPSAVIITKNEEIVSSGDSRIEELENRVTKLENTNNATEGASSTLPDYWEAYLPDKVAAIKALQNVGGKDCFSFVFMTDMHYPSNLGKRSPAIAKRIMDECNIKFALNGGDNNTRGCYQTKEEILAENKQVKEMFTPIKDRVLQVEGNHDGSYYWSGGTVGSGDSYAKQFTEKEMFEEYYRANGLNMDVHFDENSNAFYVDDVSNKVRYIGLNSMNVPNEATDINEDGTAKYTKFHVTRFLQAQYDFLCNEALVNGLTDAWSVVVFGHSGIYNAGDYAVMVDVLSAYKDKTNCVAEYAGTAGGVAYTNLAEPLPDNTTDNTKWVNGYRISSTAVTTSSGSGKTTCNPIPVTTGDVIRVKGVSFVASVDRAGLFKADGTSIAYLDYVSSLPIAELGYELVDGVHTFTVLTSNTTVGTFRCAFTTPTDASSVIITKNEEIVEGGGGDGYDYVSVNHDFTNAKGKFIAYFHGHEHQDMDYTRDSIKDIATRCDAQEEYEEVDRAERVAGTTTEQSFDVFTVNKKTRTIYATKIGAGADREINY